MDFQNELIVEYDREAATTRKILEAIPADVDWTYKPNPKSMALGRLAGHVAETTGEWALHTLTQDKLIFEPGHNFEQYVPASKEALLERFDREVPQVKAALVNLPADKWDEKWQMGANGQVWIDDTKYRVWRIWVISHLTHHRAQLGVYLRALGYKLPGTYGPSADEM
ncbi:MAG: DinB family protein [Terracidiphilus sp.]|jgi:uncharacterized damage-inducible protein DinB